MAVDTLVTGSKLTAIANAIRAKTGGTTRLTLDDMPAEIEGITGQSEYLHGSTMLCDDSTASIVDGFCIYGNPVLRRLSLRSVAKLRCTAFNSQLPGSDDWYKWSLFPEIDSTNGYRPFLYGNAALETVDIRSLSSLLLDEGEDDGTYRSASSCYNTLILNCASIKELNLDSYARVEGPRVYERTKLLSINTSDDTAMWPTKINLRSLTEVTISGVGGGCQIENKIPYSRAPSAIPKLRMCLDSLTYARFFIKNMWGLESAYLPSCSTLGTSAFNGVADGFKLVLPRTDSAVTLNGAASDIIVTPNDDYSVYVPSSLFNAYRSRAGWNNIQGRIFAIEDYPDVVAAVIADSVAAKSGWD